MVQPETNPANIVFGDGDCFFWTHDGKDYCLHIQQEDEPLDPRDDENIATLACWHRRHNFGDDINGQKAGDFFKEIIRKYADTKELTHRLRTETFPGLNKVFFANAQHPYEEFMEQITEYDLADAAIKGCEPYAVIIPIWMYDHSGQTIRCGQENPFNDQFDSGRLGWGVITKAQALKNLTCDESNWKDAAARQIQAEVEAYDCYITGTVYCYDLYARDTNDRSAVKSSLAADWETLDGCGNYLGHNLAQSGLLESVGHGFETAIRTGAYRTGKSRTITTLAFQED